MEGKGEIPLVLLVRTRVDGPPVSQWLPAPLAIAEAGWGDGNGIEWESCRIIADDVDMGQWDGSV